MRKNRRREKGAEGDQVNGKEASADEVDSKLIRGYGGASVVLVPTTNHLQTVSPDDDISNNFQRIVSLGSLAPTAEVEEFESPSWRRVCDTVIEMGEEEEILGLDYPHESSTFSAQDVDVGHFLCGGAGLDALSLQDLPEPEIEDEPPSAGHYIPPMPTLASISTLWDNLLCLCDIPHCGKKASSKCAACLNAFYCGDEHQRLDWDNHWHQCSPFIKSFVTSMEGRGVVEGMVSTRKISQGQALFTEKPLLLFPLASRDGFDHPLECLGIERNNLCRAMEPACLGCTKAVEFVGPNRHRCSTCTLPLCSKACEYEASHQLQECQAILEGNLRVSEPNVLAPCFHALYLDVEILRALRLGRVDEALFLDLLELQHNSRVRAYAKTVHFRRFKRDVERIAPLAMAFAKGNRGLVIVLHAIIATNSFRPSLGSTFKLLFRRQADFFHSCLPNTVHYIENEGSRDQCKMRLVTKAAVTIPSDEVICIDFLPSPYLPRPHRERLLREMGIQCRCPRCTQPGLIGDFTVELKCRLCGPGYVRPDEPQRWSESVWSCGNCMEETPFEVLNRAEKEVSLQLMELPKKKYEDIPGLIKFISTVVDTVHPGHPLIIHSWCFIESLLRKRMEAVRDPNPDKRYDEDSLRNCVILVEYSDMVLPHLDVIRQGLWVDKGLVLFHKFYAHYILSCEEFHQSRTTKKDFTTSIFKCLKILDMSLQNLRPFEGMRASNQAILKTIHEATNTLITLKDFAAQLIQHQPRPSWKNS